MTHTLFKITAGLCIAAAICLTLALLRGVLGFVVVGLVLAACVAIYVFRVPLQIKVRAKLAEWSSDVKQLGLWLSLAFKRNRDAQATAAMVHQQAFLTGRIMSPMNLFFIAGMAIVGSLGVVGFQEWRIGRIKRERDAPCSQRELTLNARGQYQTSRASCAALGETLTVAVQWQARAKEFEALRESDLARVRSESEALLAADRERRTRAEATASRQRRRQNEAVISALGGAPPDLERSVCELAGGDACGVSVAADGASPAAASDLPAAAVDAASPASADAPSGGEPAGR